MKYDKEQLYETNMHSLRKIAREMGVYAPTRLNKKELIREILEIDSGEKLPCAPSKRGRPIKNDLESNYVAPTPPNTVEENETLLKERIKQELISSILKDVEKRLNTLL